MSNELQHKMYNHEVTPPVTAWDKISAALDDSYLTDKFPSLLYNGEAEPPPAAWAAISTSLDELNLSTQFPSTLYNLETPPPPRTWEKIQAVLEAEDTPAIPQRRRVIPFVRYAAAAAVLALIAFGTVKILDSSKTVEQPGFATQPSNPSIKTPVPTASAPGESISPQNEVVAKSQDSRDADALEQSKHTYASLDASDKRRMKKVSEEFFQSPADPIIVAANFNPAHTFENLDCSDVNTPTFAGGPSSMDIAGRYALLMSPDGYIIRISKKLGELVCCVSGEEQDEQCIDQLKKWRKKIANSPVAPAPGNFMDILDLVHTLKDNNL